jgi:predicted unusual protein kinase regulating ubiquinone biosynthesis (AarF/ABC1/UbiB family)
MDFRHSPLRQRILRPAILAIALLALSLLPAVTPSLADLGSVASTLTSPLSAAPASTRPAPATIEDGKRLRAFLRDLISETVEIRDSTADDVRKVLARHPQVFRWVIEGRDLQAIIKEADLEGLKIPPGMLDSALKSPARNGKLPGLLLSKLEASSEDSRFEFLKKVEDSHFLKIATDTQQNVAEFELHKTPAARILTNPKGELGLTDETLARFMSNVLPGYFEKMDRLDKSRIIIAELELPPHAAQSQQLSTMLQSSGPCMQKLFQLIGKDVKNPALASTMLALQNEIRPFSGDIAVRTIEERYGKRADQLFKSFDRTPLAAASVGQVHAAELLDGQKVAVKIRRPRIMEIATREIGGLLAASSNEPAAQEMLKKVGQTVLDELNFRNEAKNIVLGSVYERPLLGISIAGQIPSLDAHEDLLISKRAPGAKISKGIQTAQDAAIRAKAIANLLDAWFDEVMFGRGFFHGDLHPGNIFFEAAPETELGYRVTLIDFGNAGALSLEERRAFLQLVLAAQTPKPERVVETFESIAKVPEDKRELLKSAYAKIYETETELTGRIDKFMIVSLENGMEIPASFISFNRARLFLEKELISLGAQLDKMDPTGKLARYSARRIYQRIALKRISGSLIRGMLHTEVRATAIITPKMLVSVFKDHLKYRASRFGGRCADYFSELREQVIYP